MVLTLGYIGLGKMGLAQVERLVEKGWRVVAWNRSEGPRKEAEKAGAEVSETYKDVCTKLKKPRLIWLMVPHVAVDVVLKELVPHLSRGDTVIDGGNSFYKNSMRRAKALARRGIYFFDVGVSGGPSGARNGACLMVGGERKVFKRHEQLFKDLSASYSPFPKGRGPLARTNFSENLRGRAVRDLEIPRSEDGAAPPFVKGESRQWSYAYVGKSGAGHFVKMVHNGIEYGMMQSLAEGFALLRAADGRNPSPPSPLSKGGIEGGFGLDLKEIAELYNQGSVIESRLVGWLAKAFREHGEELKNISGEVAQSGEGLWTVETAKELGVPVKVIEDSLKFRIKSKGNPSYTGQVVSALRNQFGGHSVRKANTE